MHPPKQLASDWQTLLQKEWEKPYLERLKNFLSEERKKKIPIYPKAQDVFTALNKVHFCDIKVVILGQDPYHGPGQAHGLSFSVLPGIPLPPSLKNIFLEIRNDLGSGVFRSGWLNSWAEQGVLLLNSVLTVRQGQPGSHNNQGWEKFTDAIIHVLVEREDPVIFVLWGKAAQDKCHSVLFDKNTHHHILSAAHPSPFSANKGFFGCCHFSKINNLLKKQNKQQINWEIL